MAVAAILLVGGANYRSLSWGAAIQNVSTLAKVLALVGLAAVIFLLADPGAGAFGDPVRLEPTGWSSFGVALIAVLWAYDGWADATYVAGEVRDPERALPRALVGGFAVVVFVYLLLNAAYLFASWSPPTRLPWCWEERERRLWRDWSSSPPSGP